jgi:biopolymer transport protein ExbD
VSSIGVTAVVVVVVLLLLLFVTGALMATQDFYVVKSKLKIRAKLGADHGGVEVDADAEVIKVEAEATSMEATSNRLTKKVGGG